MTECLSVASVTFSSKKEMNLEHANAYNNVEVAWAWRGYGSRKYFVPREDLMMITNIQICRNKSPEGNGGSA